MSSHTIPTVADFGHRRAAVAEPDAEPDFTLGLRYRVLGREERQSALGRLGHRHTFAFAEQDVPGRPERGVEPAALAPRRFARR